MIKAFACYWVWFNDRVILVFPGQDAVKGGKLNGIHVATAIPAPSPFIFFNDITGSPT